MEAVRRELVSVRRGAPYPSPRSGHEALALGKASRAVELVSLSVGEVAFGVEMVVDIGVIRGESLQGPHPPKSLHHPLSLPQRQVRVLGSIVEPPPHLATIFDAEFAHRRWVRFEPIGDDLKRTTMMLQGLF